VAIVETLVLVGRRLRSTLSPALLENRIQGKRPRSNGEEREAYPKGQPLLLDESWGVNLHQKQRSEHIHRKQETNDSGEETDYQQDAPPNSTMA